MNTETLSDGAVTGAVRTWLRAEALSVLTLSVLLYWHSESSWWMFIGLLLTPDLAMLPYLLNPRVGSLSYNIVHSYLLPLSLATVAIAVYRVGILPFLCIWTAHIGMDRFLGYGLKYSTSFGRTHLGMLRTGREKLVSAPGNEC
ncbi:MAG TPA: DUF4260 domain-containing protein [Candidatus Binataceae bacterium]|nr:DUF4260 domain-containing protein [Candidatus Binataceae bacterium]